jgi:hypothetical protein
MVQPSTKMARVSSSGRSAWSSRPTLHSTVARRVCCRWGRSTAPVPSASSDLASRPSRASGSSSRVRAAASSIANGTPSRRWQISTTAQALSSVRAKSPRTARARSTNSATAGEACSSGTDMVVGSAGSGSGGTGYTCSARSPSTVRLVARMATPPQRASSSSRSPAASSTCSRLSRTSSQAPSPSCSTRASGGASVPARSTPTARAMPASTSAGWVTPASGTNTAPAAKSVANRPPAANARRVLPIPPGPVRVTSRTSGQATRPATSSMAPSRPTSEVVARGSRRRPRPPGVPDGAGGDPGSAASVPAAAKRSLSSAARSSPTSRPSSLGVRKYREASEASWLMRSSSSARRGSRSGAGVLTYSSRGSAPRPGQLELLLQPRDLHARAGPPVALPVQPHEDITLGQVGPVEVLWGVRPRPSSNSTGVSRSAEMARETARRSAASSPCSPTMELTNTRRRRSGVRITTSARILRLLSSPVAPGQSGTSRLALAILSRSSSGRASVVAVLDQVTTALSPPRQWSRSRATGGVRSPGSRASRHVQSPRRPQATACGGVAS